MRPLFLISAISWMLAGPVHAPAQTPEGESVSVVAFGAKGDGVTDDRAAIQAAIDSISSGVVTLPPAPGGYLLSLAPGKTDFLVLKSSVQLVGIGNPVLRVAPSSPPYDHVISSSYCEDCSIQHLTIDANIQANPIKDQAEIYAHPRIEIAFAGGRRIRVHNVTIRNSSSVNSIVTGVPASDVAITHCVFAANGDDPNHVRHDHSALYIHADGAVIDGNIFTSVRRGAPAAVTAIETHGSAAPARPPATPPASASAKTAPGCSASFSTTGIRKSRPTVITSTRTATATAAATAITTTGPRETSNRLRSGVNTSAFREARIEKDAVFLSNHN